MDMLGVNQPDFGHLLSGMVFNEGQPVDTSKMIAPRAEAEVAFILAKDLTGPGVTADDVIRATECVMPCFEIVDSRIKDWKIKIQDTVADNASCGVFVLGGTRCSPTDIDLALAGMVLEKKWRDHQHLMRRIGAGLASQCGGLAGQYAGRIRHHIESGRCDPVRFAVASGPGSGR